MCMCDFNLVLGVGGAAGFKIARGLESPGLEFLDCCLGPKVQDLGLVLKLSYHA